MVEVHFSGEGNMTKLKIDDKLEHHMIEDLTIVAVNNAQDKLNKEIEATVMDAFMGNAGGMMDFGSMFKK